MDKTPIITLKDVKVHFPQSQGFKKKFLRAVDGVSFSIYQGETVGLVGESGCGKSTLGKAIVGLLKPTAGQIFYHDNDITKLKKDDFVKYRKNVQMIFQDPAASLNPRLKVSQIVMESLLKNVDMSKQEKKELVKKMIKTVGLSDDAPDKYPHEFSGGQQQRVGIARSLVLNPEFIVCDEAVSALDVSVQAQILNLLLQLKKDYNLTYLFISHNLSVVKHMCDRIVVMYLGKIVEIGSRDQVFENPLHPYTKALLSAIPVAGKKERENRIVLTGDLPSPTDVIEGCAFHNRCYECCEECNVKCPELREVEPGHFVSCIK
ncbi:MAG: ABC transporter ATP-binding protein [Ruminococcaceae bacterium]|nr:ABC transporter ATP-binding protein [Oscillospiraceae bacterium]